MPSPQSIPILPDSGVREISYPIHDKDIDGYTTWQSQSVEEFKPYSHRNQGTWLHVINGLSNGE